MYRLCRVCGLIGFIDGSEFTGFTRSMGFLEGLERVYPIAFVEGL